MLSSSNCIIINGVAIIGSNGWWTWDFDNQIDDDQSRFWWKDKMNTNLTTTDIIHDIAINDVAYLTNCVDRLQKHPDVKHIVIVTHTVPLKELIIHDLNLVDNYEFNKMGNSLMPLVLDADTENKISTWCFGHYHNSVDYNVNGIRYVNNCKGRTGDLEWQRPYYPKRITIEY